MRMQMQMPIWRLFIVVKPPWIDSVANGKRPYVFQYDSPPSYNALKTQDWMAENFHDHVTPKLMAAF
ncbi:hypothetical protein ACTXT7_014327 [Hymenolepis weldensis]